jgi:hypothetical protein
MVKVTFSLDDATVDQIRRASIRLGRPQSQIVREAVSDYATRVDRLVTGPRRSLPSTARRWRLPPICHRVYRARAAARSIWPFPRATLAHGAGLWSLNPDDFSDIPGLTLV